MIANSQCQQQNNCDRDCECLPSDRHEALVKMMQRICDEIGAKYCCSDYDPEDYERLIINAFAKIKSTNS